MPKRNPGQRRERKVEGQTLFLKCWGTFHDGEWLRHNRFHKRRADTYSTFCKECSAYQQAKARGGDGAVRLDLVRKWLWEVVSRCGGTNSAARTLGVSSPTIYRWLGRYKGYENKRIYRKSVQRILETLGGLRDGTVTPDIRTYNGAHTRRKRFRYGCPGCGQPREENTLGCLSCWERHYRKEYRAQGREGAGRLKDGGSADEVGV